VELVTAPAVSIRVIHRMLEEARAVPMDDASRTQLLGLLQSRVEEWTSASIRA
jgi:hypothetical protein